MINEDTNEKSISAVVAKIKIKYFYFQFVVFCMAVKPKIINGDKNRCTLGIFKIQSKYSAQLSSKLGMVITDISEDCLILNKSSS